MAAGINFYTHGLIPKPKNANTNSTLLDLFIMIFTCVSWNKISLPHKGKAKVCVHSTCGTTLSILLLFVFI